MSNVQGFAREEWRHTLRDSEIDCAIFESLVDSAEHGFTHHQGTQSCATSLATNGELTLELMRGSSGQAKRLTYASYRGDDYQACEDAVIDCELGGVLPESQTPQTPLPPRDPGIVPRIQRRGLLASLTVIPEVERPKEYSNKVKWTITLFTAVAGAAAPMGSAIFYRT